MSCSVARYAQEMDFRNSQANVPPAIGHEMAEISFQMCKGDFSNARRFQYMCREFLMGESPDDYFHNMIDIGLKTLKLREWLDTLRQDPTEDRLKEYITYMRSYRNLYPECLLALREDLMEARGIIGDIARVSDNREIEEGVERAAELVDDVIS
jgi:hypothetical protein